MSNLSPEPLSWSPESELAGVYRELARRKQARTRLEHFTTYTHKQYRVEPFHSYLAAALDRVVSGEIKRLMVFAPPQSGKSELVSVRLPAYWLGRRPEDPVILSSYAASLAEDKSRQVRQIVESAEFGKVFPGCKTQTDSRAKNLWHLDGHRGKMLAVGVGGPITGHGALLGIIDDPVENWEQAQSQTFRDKTWDWWRTTFRTRIWEGGSVCLVMTRWHRDDLAGRLLEEQGEDWTVLRLAAVAETQEERDRSNHILGLPRGEPDPLGREPGEPLCPGRFSREALDSLKRDVGPLAWPGQYQGVPHEAEGAIFKRAWFQRYEDRGDVAILIPSGEQVFWKNCQHFAVADPAASEKTSADYTAIGVFADMGEQRLALRHMVRERLGLTNIVPAIAALCRTYPIRWVGIEADGFQNAVAVEAEQDPDIPTVLRISHESKGKLPRAHAAIIRASQQKIYLPVGAEWVDIFIEEAVSFSGNQDPHDDQIDVLAHGVTAIDMFGSADTGQPIPLYTPSIGGGGMGGYLGRGM